MGYRLRKVIRYSFVRMVIEHFSVILFALIIILTSREYNNDIGIFIKILYFVIILFVIKFVYLIVKQILLIKQIDISECNEIEKQLRNPIIFSRWDYALTDGYLINIKRFEVIKYNDIVLIYKRIGFNLRRSLLERHLYVVTNKGKRQKFLINYPLTINLNSLVDFSDIIKAKNPNVLIGKNKKN